MELQRIVNSGRRSIVQRNEGHCSHSNETSNDITRVHSSHLGPDACVRRARHVLFRATYSKPNQEASSKL